MSNRSTLRLLVKTTALACLVVASIFAVVSTTCLGAPALAGQVSLGPSGPVTSTRTDPTGAISGTVTDAATGAPISEAIVTLVAVDGSNRWQRRMTTDDKGRFVFVALPAGNGYALTAGHPRYFDSTYGADSQASARPISLADGQWFSDARIRMWRPGAIAGVVTDEAGDPMPGIVVRALVQITVAGHAFLASGPMAITDDRGAYRLANLVPGRYVIQVPSVQASAPAGMDSFALAGMTAQSAAAAQAAGRTVSKETAVAGDPGAQLIVGRYPTPPPPSRDGRWMTYPITYYPRALSLAEAVPIEVARNDDHPGADIRLEPVPTARIAGVVQAPPEALTRLQLRLVPAGLEELALGSEAATSLVTADGHFVFLGVPSGAYTLDAPRNLNEYTVARFSLGPGSMSMPRPPGSSGVSFSSNSVAAAPSGVSFVSQSFRGEAANYSGQAPLVVDGRDRSDIVLPLQPAGQMTGRIVLDHDPATTDAAAPAFVSVSAEPAGGSPRLGVPRASTQGAARDQFTLTGLLAGQYVLRTATSAGWLLKSVQWNGRDYTMQPFDAAGTMDFSGVVITLTNEKTAIAGTVRDDRGAGTPDACVIAFPVDPLGWTNYGLTPNRITTTMAGQGGAYRITTLPGGDYYLIAVPAADADAWQTPDFFKRAAASAVRIHVEWRQNATQELRVKEVK